MGSRYKLIIITTLLALLFFTIACVALWYTSPPNTQNHPGVQTAFTPPLYLGLDAFRSLDKLSYLALGDRIVGQSTADPGGSNSDNIHSLRTLPGGGRVLFDQIGPGLVTFMRMQQDYGGPWTLSLDDHFQSVISSNDLGQMAISGPFPYPLSLNPAQSQGSSIIATAIPFQRHMIWVSQRANGNFYAIYHRLPYGTPLPQWTGERPPEDVVRLLRRSGSDIAPTGIAHQESTIDLAGKEPTLITTLTGPSQIRALSFSVPTAEMVRFANARLLISWDGEAAPAVDAPIKFLVGDGAGVYQPAGRPLVNGWLAGTGGSDPATMQFNLYWPMPFSKSARIALLTDTPLHHIGWRVRYEPFLDPVDWWGTFHTTYTNVPNPAQGQDMTFLDVTGSGRMVGTVINFTAPDGTLEGDPHIYLDESQTPQIAVTGTEEWGMGGDYWNRGHQTTLPLGGMPGSVDNPPGTDHDGAALYRFLVADSIPFNRHLLVRWEHGSANQSRSPYRAVVFWYGIPTQTAILSDEVLPAENGRAHNYQAQNERTYRLSASYEYQVHAPLLTMNTTSMTSSTSFTLALNPRNVGAFLRRTFDYCIPNQKANIFLDGHFAGVWYSAGVSDRVDAQGHQRCWREEEFPLPPSMTVGKSSIRVKIDVVPTPDTPNSAWTASRYQLYSLVLPSHLKATSPSRLSLGQCFNVDMIFYAWPFIYVQTLRVGKAGKQLRSSHT